MNHRLRAQDLALLHCHMCGQLSRDTGAGQPVCPRCRCGLHRRRPNSQVFTWALLIAAITLYLPANLLPVMRTVSLGDTIDSTILSGIIHLWMQGSWPLAAIVFTASILVPITKFMALLTLLLTARHGSNWARRQRARMYRIMEKVGYWSMLDVFVVALLGALVKFGFFSQVVPMPGVVYFGLSVILTMLATMSFDPRLIWDGDDDE